MLPHEGTTLLGVTAETRLVHRTRHQQLLIRRPVRAVTAYAFHLPLAERHVRELAHRRCLFPVAASACSQNRSLLQVRSLCIVMHHDVAVGAGHVSRLVCASGPHLSLIHISEPTRLGMISYAVFCLKKKKQIR